MNNELVIELKKLVNLLELEILEKQNELDKLLEKYDELTEEDIED